MLPTDKSKFVSVSNEALLNFLKSAQHRIIAAKPGYIVDEIIELLDLSKSKGVKCTIYVDSNEKAVRWGFGEKDALKLIIDNQTKLDVQAAEHIRLSVIIVDDSALVYSPVALAWEKEPEKLDFPNGILCGSELVEGFISQIGVDDNKQTPEQQSEIFPNESIKKVIQFPGCSIPKKEKQTVSNNLEKTIEKLEKTPPVDPAKLRKVTVYRNNLKIVKISVHGGDIKNKSLNLNPFNKLFPDIDSHLKSSWKVFSTEDLEDMKHFKKFRKDVDELVEKYTLDVKRFGKLIGVVAKDEFNKVMDSKKALFIQMLEEVTSNENTELKESKEDKVKENASENDSTDAKEKSIGELLSSSRDSLKKYLLNFINDTEGAGDILLNTDSSVKKLVNNKTIEKDRAIETIIETIIDEDIKFPESDSFVSAVDIKIDYYDVSDELLNESDEFKNCLEELKQSKNSGDEIKIRHFSDAFEELNGS
jgi:hypothetical protein